MHQFLAITKALSDANRVRMLCALRGGELCVCQLIELIQLAPSTISKHLSIMQQAGLIESRKEGRWVYYRLPSNAGERVAARLTGETFRALADCTVVVQDHQQLEEIRAADLEEICRNIASKN